MITCAECQVPLREGEGHSLCPKCLEDYREELRKLAADNKMKPLAPALAQPKETK